LAPMKKETWDEWRCETLHGVWWENDPSDVAQRKKRQQVSRTSVRAENRVNRVNRLKAIGNGQVPGAAALAWEILKGGEK